MNNKWIVAIVATAVITGSASTTTASAQAEDQVVVPDATHDVERSLIGGYGEGAEPSNHPIDIRRVTATRFDDGRFRFQVNFRRFNAKSWKKMGLTGGGALEMSWTAGRRPKARLIIPLPCEVSAKASTRRRSVVLTIPGGCIPAQWQDIVLGSLWYWISDADDQFAYTDQTELFTSNSGPAGRRRLPFR